MFVAVNSILAAILCALLLKEAECACENLTAVEEAPELPKLPEQFQATMFVTWANSDEVAEVVEYYDFVNNKGAVYSRRGNKSAIYLNNFETYESFIIQDGTCKTRDMRTANMTWFDYVDDNGVGHVGSFADILHLSAKYKPVYLGKMEIRTIPTYHWASCIDDKKLNRNYTAHYYFSEPDYRSPAGQMSIPVKFESSDADDPSFQTTYDFPPLFKPGPIRDPTVFEVPHGYVCTHAKKQKEMPQIDEHFTAHMEFISQDSSTKQIDSSFMAFNYDLKLSRYDVKPSVAVKKGSSRWPFGEEPTTFIHDFQTGVEYAINIRSRECRKQPIRGGRDVKWIANTSRITMDHGYELFQLSSFDFYYQGQRVWRGIDCDVWSTAAQDKPNQGDVTVLEAYFAQSDWVAYTDGDELNPQEGDGRNVLLGLWTTTTGSDSTITETPVHVYDYNPAAPAPSLFDIRDCFDFPGNAIHAIFRIEGAYAKVASRKSHILAPAVWRVIAQNCGVVPVRIADIYFDATSPDATDVWFTILPESGVKSVNVSDVQKEITKDEAFQKLKDSIKSGLAFKVKYGEEEKELKVKKDTLATDKDTFDPRKTKTYTTVYQGHSNGSMAGLGIGMFLVGCVGGVIMLVMWQRRQRTRIPYSRDI